MIDGHGGALPSLVERVLEESERTGIRFGSDMRVGALLRVLAASKPGGDLLELGTGTGLGTAWLLAGMTAGATLVSIDDDEVGGVATRALGGDPRLTLLHMDAGAFLSLRASSPTSRAFDLIFADANGVVRIPQQAIPSVYAELNRAFDEESSTQKGLVAGEDARDLFDRYGRF